MTYFSVFVSVSTILSITVAQSDDNTKMKIVSSYPEPCALVSSSSSTFYATIPTPTSSFQISADVAFACQLSAPFNQNLSIELIDYILPYINFQSDLAYLKNPPSTYLMPAVDILGGLQEIWHNASAGTYTSQYAFDAAITNLVAKAHNGHFIYVSGLISTFQYHNDKALISISKDGLTLPEVYVGTDAIQHFENPSFVPSPVISINEVNVATYLGHVQGNNQMGMEMFFQDPDAAYNSMFYSLRSSAGGSAGFFATAGVVTTPAASYLLGFQNGTSLNVSNFATPTVSFDNVTSGAELLSATELKIPHGSDQADNSPIVLANGYPKPIIQHSQGYVAGYFLNTTNYTDTAVLALFTFNPSTIEWTQEYQSVVQNFLAKCTAAGKTNLVIDLSGNTGGDPYLASDVFKQLFPHKYPYHAARLRATEELNFIGSRLADVPYNTSTYNLINYETFETTNGINFPSWSSVFGPYPIYGDNFTSQVLLNFSDPIQTVDVDGMVVTGYLNRSQGFTQPFATNNIVLLYDGNCASACAHFSEMMLVEAEVSSIVFGGRPQYGVMAGVGAVKGFYTVSFSNLQLLTSFALNISKMIGIAVPKRLSLPSIKNAPLYPALARINSGNIIRRGDETNTPTQFLYDVADCRFFWTAENLIDATTIWERAANYRWGNATCVQSSVGNATSTANATASKGLSSASAIPTSNHTSGSRDLRANLLVCIIIINVLFFVIF